MIVLVLVAPVRAHRDALTAAFAADAEFRISGHARSFVEAATAIAPQHPTVTLVDFTIANVVAVLQAVRRAAPTTLMIGYGIEPGRDHADVVVRAAEAGLAGFVDVDQPVEDIITAVRLALSGQSSCSPRIAALLLQAMQQHPEPPRYPSLLLAGPALTPRERVVAELVCRGLTNRQIASRLVVAESTVKTHVHSILAKLGITQRGEIALSGAVMAQLENT